MSAVPLARLLDRVIPLVEAAGAMLAEEFARPGGPRGGGEHADIDDEIEAMLRAALLDLHPARYVGEETGEGGDARSRDCWLVDPHDGTRAFLKGHRGTAVSVALLRDGIPVLGVVYAPLPADRGPDLIAWAEGLPQVLRNGAPSAAWGNATAMAPGAIVFLNDDSGRKPATNGHRVSPARFIAMPSIAYRLARVAAGDGVATVSLNGPCGHDYAAGHALLRGAGGVLIDERGQPVTYTTGGHSQVHCCIGGTAPAAADLAGRDWRVTLPEPHAPTRITLPLPRPATDVGLDRAVGCLFGQVIGDSLGSLVEFRDVAAIAASYPDGVRNLADGGTWHTIAGQPTDDSELALALARTLAARDAFDIEALATAYGAWIASAPFDIGTTTRRGLGAAGRATSGKAAAASAASDRDSQSNGSLMRVSPIGIWAASASEAAEIAARDSALSHPHPVCLAACAAYAAAIFTGIAGGTRDDMIVAADAVAAASDGAAPVRTILAEARAGRFPVDYQINQGWVLIALQNAFAHLAQGDAPEPALVATVGRGGDTDTNGAIAGALLGAAWGRDGFPPRWRHPVLACRTGAGLGVSHPRPPEYWPTDVPDVAEALLARRRRAAIS